MLNPPPYFACLSEGQRGKSVFQKDSGAKKEVVLFEAPPPPTPQRGKKTRTLLCLSRSEAERKRVSGLSHRLFEGFGPKEQPQPLSQSTV